jgi:hypothetical protein
VQRAFSAENVSNKIGFSVTNVKAYEKSTDVENEMLYYVCDSFQKEINYQNDSYKIDSSVECGEDILPGATLHSRVVVKNMSSKLYLSCFQFTILYAAYFLFCSHTVLHY